MFGISRICDRGNYGWYVRLCYIDQRPQFQKVFYDYHYNHDQKKSLHAAKEYRDIILNDIGIPKNIGGDASKGIYIVKSVRKNYFAIEAYCYGKSISRGFTKADMFDKFVECAKWKRDCQLEKHNATAVNLDPQLLQEQFAEIVNRCKLKHNPEFANWVTTMSPQNVKYL